MVRDAPRSSRLLLSPLLHLVASVRALVVLDGMEINEQRLVILALVGESCADSSSSDSLDVAMGTAAAISAV